jgi:medium-chain acyl-[acyl-carrier-protein] hydrolase
MPGRGNRLLEPFYRQLEPLINDLAEELLPYLDREFAIFGHSMGAIISFELARHLRMKYGLRPAHLFVSGRRAPHLKDDDPPTYNLPDAELIKELSRLNGTPQEVFESPELMGLMLPMLRADFELVQTYEYKQGPALDFPLTALGGLQDPEVSRSNLESWCQYTDSRFSLRLLPGDHFFLRTSEDLLLQLITGDLYKVMNSTADERLDRLQKYSHG